MARAQSGASHTPPSHALKRLPPVKIIASPVVMQIP